MDILTYALAKNYTDKALLGVGTIKGAPCTVKSQTEDDEYVYVTLGWENNLGTSEETVVKIKKGADGAPGEPGPAGDPGPQGVSITKIEKIKTEDLIDTYQISFSDNTTFEYTISNGSTDYLNITNKPSIEGVELTGNKTFEDLNIASADALTATDENLQNLSNLIGDKTSLPAPTDTIVNNITSVDAKVDAIIDDNEAGLAKTFSSDKITKTFATKEEIPTVPNKVSELTNDSNYQTAEQVNSTVTTEIAKIVADAPEDLNTLKEMSDWIAGHEDDASAMNSAISDNKTAITALQTDKADKSEIPTTLPANGGNSDTVNNHTVETNVPTDAVFTDTIYDDTEVKGSIDELNSNLSQLEFGEIAGGKNLFNGNFIEKVLDIGINYTDVYLSKEQNTIKDIKGITYATFGAYLKKGTYTFSYTNNAYFSLNRIAIAGTNCISVPISIRKSYTWTQNIDGWTYFGIEGDDSETGVTDTPFSITPNIMIEKGTTATEYEPYIPSVKMLADEVKTQKNDLDNLEYGEVAGGKNLFDGKFIVGEGTYAYAELPKSNVHISISDRDTSVDISNIYFGLSNNVVPASDTMIWTFVNNGTIVGRGSNDFINSSFTAKSLSIYPSDANTVTKILQRFNIQIEEGTTATDYEPYIPSVKMLAEENAQQNTEAMDLKMLGWTVPSECPIQNYVDSDGVYHQIVGRVDLGTLNWTYDVPNTQFYTDIISQIKQDGDWIYDVYCSKYITASYGDKRIALNRGRIYIGDSSYTDGDSLKHSLRGVYLYFELSTPITMTIDGNEAVTKLKNDLDKLNLLPKGFIIQIDADKDDIETTKQKYGWQYLGTSNIEYESGSANILVTNVYRKNN